MAVSEPWTQWCLKIKTIIAVDKQADTDTRGGVVQTLPPPPGSASRLDPEWLRVGSRAVQYVHTSLTAQCR